MLFCFFDFIMSLDACPKLNRHPQIASKPQVSMWKVMVNLTVQIVEGARVRLGLTNGCYSRTSRTLLLVRLFVCGGVKA